MEKTSFKLPSVAKELKRSDMKLKKLFQVIWVGNNWFYKNIFHIRKAKEWIW